MAQIIVDTPTHWETNFIRIEYLSDKNYVDEVWKDFAEDEEVRDAQNKVLEILAASKSTAYIADMLNFRGASPEIQAWVVEEWFPKMYDAGLRTLAMVVPEDFYAVFSYENVIGEGIALKLNKEKFTEYNKASEWIEGYCK